MSRKVKIDNIPDDVLKKINSDLSIKIEATSYGQQEKYIFPYGSDENGYAYIPFAYGLAYPRPDKDLFAKMSNNVTFDGELRPHQKEVKSEAIQILNKTGSVIISCYASFGKTALAIYLAVKIGLKAMVIIHRVVLINQWKDAIKRFCPDAKIQIVTSSDKIDAQADFYIMNPIIAIKRPREDFRHIGVLLVDEVHLILAEGLSKCMTCFVPRYILGLSATPFRDNETDKLFTLYFGPERIYRKLNKKHTVYKINTNFTPKLERGSNGRIVWGTLLESQAMDPDRNDMIIRLVKHFNDRVILIMCKRVEQGRLLVKLLKKEKVSVASLLGNQQEYDYNTRVLVGSCQKVGVGFDNARLDMLIMAADIEAYFQQYLARVMRTEHGHPIIIDIVDKNPILEKHYKTRRDTYLAHGGVIKKFESVFPDFETC
jgi:superfamily II DNA or RNA helicase